MTALRIGTDLELPLDFVTSTQAILAKKGSGKSYTASVQAEELLGAGQQIVVVDPTGAWHGLRSSADGQSPGFPIAVLGGEHGDVPLEVSAGEVIAEAVATEHFSAVLDLSMFRKGEATRFMAAFLETLYRRNRDALHLFVDEADVVAPQKPFGVDEARALGATEDVVRRGRIRGLGCTLITQRPQVLNKNVLSQVDMLTALRMNHPKDLGAIREWVAVHADEGEAKTMLASLPSLPIGEAWFWAPAADLFQRAKVRRRLTFDSGATPKAGQRVSSPKVLASVDLARLGATIAATAERAKENDPKALRAEVLRLRQEIAELRAAPAADPRVEQLAVELQRHRGDLERIREAVARAAEVALVGQPLAVGPGTVPDLTRTPPPPRHPNAAYAKSDPNGVTHRASAPRSPATKPGDPELGGGHRKILTALARYPGGRTKQQVAILTGYSHKGGGFSNYISALRSKGYVAGDGGCLTVTPAGLEALGSFDPLPTGRALFEHWVAQLGRAEREVLRVLYEEWPAARPKEYVATKAGYEAKGGGFNNALSRLRTLELIEGRAKLRCSDALHDGGDR